MTRESWDTFNVLAWKWPSLIGASLKILDAVKGMNAS
jgi:hypothetical protein